ncbi:phosphoribosyltransferase domain-containing protein [Tenacibaculum retecalamus]|uniref:phosphoribosyltransferase domain-containing protein n=1 Tax=Tenacibaculum retecalamus TaxID=3018315 RepID=UPI0023D91061|nr:phosphoribosyltransferase domain-containing protein [Tenacibaculum retecalamus]WBX72354.1 phosphoribosyltransferase domain-containing protein [Tenacibaculum retecalamus]
MTIADNIILDNLQVEQKIRRIAFQIYESNSNEEEIIIAGIAENGYLFAEKVHEVLSNISPLKVELCKVYIDKKNPINAITTSLTVNEYKNKSLVLVDDVLNSGTTLIYAVKHFLEVPLKRFKTAVLVNRNHKKYPVKADFKGISLSTSIKEHVVVEFNKNKTLVYLM